MVYRVNARWPWIRVPMKVMFKFRKLSGKMGENEDRKMDEIVCRSWQRMGGSFLWAVLCPILQLCSLNKNPVTWHWEDDQLETGKTIISHILLYKINPCIEKLRNILDQIWKVHTPWFQTYYKNNQRSKVPLLKKKHTNLWNRIASPEINSHVCGQCDNGDKSTQWRQEKSVQQTVLRKLSTYM